MNSNVKMPFPSLSKAIKEIIDDPKATQEQLEQEVTKLKYSSIMRASARYYFEQRTKNKRSQG